MIPRAPLLRFAPLAALVVLHAAVALAAWHFGAGMNSDSATGFQLWDNWRAGHPFNHQLAPDPADLARDVSFFQAWWSPGQYLIVAPLQLLGLTLGQSIALGTFFWTGLGLVGWWRLYTVGGFDEPTRLASIVVLGCNWTFLRNYGDYMGGELALLSLAPWLILALWTVAARGSAALLLLSPALVWLGTMAKNTFLPVAAATLLVARWRWPLLPVRRLALDLTVIGLALALGQGLFWLTFLSHGWHPGSGGLGGLSSDASLNLARLVSFPLGGVFSLQNLLGRVFLHPSAPRAAGWTDLAPLLLVLAVVLGALTLWLVRRELALRPAYGRLVAATTLASLAFFALFAVTRDVAGLEERFLRPCSFLLLPAVVAALRAGGSWLLRAPLLALAFVGTAYGAASGPLRARHIANADNTSSRGVHQAALSRAAFAELRALDQRLPAGSLIVLPSPDAALERFRCRVWATHFEMASTDSVAPQDFTGSVPALLLVASRQRSESPELARLLRRFTAFPASAWQRHEVDGWVFHLASAPPRAP